MALDIRSYHHLLWKLLRDINTGYHRPILKSVTASTKTDVLEIHLAFHKIDDKPVITTLYLDEHFLHIPYPNMAQTVPVIEMLNGTITNENFVIGNIKKACEANYQHALELKKIEMKYKKIIEAENVVI